VTENVELVGWSQGRIIACQCYGFGHLGVEVTNLMRKLEKTLSGMIHLRRGPIAARRGDVER